MKKLQPKSVQTYCLAALAVGMLFGFIGILTRVKALSVICVVVLIASVVFRFIFYRCPHCEKYLDRSGGDFCPYCGRKINE